MRSSGECRDDEGRESATFEGLEQDQAGRPILEAFVVEDAAQGGYCTPDRDRQRHP